MASNNNKEEEVEEVKEVKEVKEVTKAVEDLDIQYIKHPLEDNWTLWYYENDRGKDWEQNQKTIVTFGTCEDFWSLYNHIKLASELKIGCDYSVFKKGIRPMWEDDANKRGGRWLISLERKQRNSNDLDTLWREVLLCMIGESFDEHGVEVCGAVVNRRPKGDKIGIWTANVEKSVSIIEIGKKLKDRLKLEKGTSFVYQAHQDNKIKTGSMTKILYTV